MQIKPMSNRSKEGEDEKVAVICLPPLTSQHMLGESKLLINRGELSFRKNSNMVMSGREVDRRVARLTKGAKKPMGVLLEVQRIR